MADMANVAEMDRVEFDIPLPKVVKMRGADNREYSLSLPANVLVEMETETGSLNVGRIAHLLKIVSLAASAAGMHGVTPEAVGKIFRGAAGLKKLQDVVFELLNIAERDERSYAPFVPTAVEIGMAALDLADFTSGDTVIDPGCGDGRILELVCERGGYSIGYEINKGRAELSRTRLAQFPERFEIHEEDGRNAPFERADVVFLYLLTDTNNLLRPVLEKKLKPGAVVASHDFLMNGPGWKQIGHKAIKLEGEDRVHNVYAYKFTPQKPLDSGAE